MNPFTEPARNTAAPSATNERKGFDTGVNSNGTNQTVTNLVADLLDGATLPVTGVAVEKSNGYVNGHGLPLSNSAVEAEQTLPPFLAGFDGATRPEAINSEAASLSVAEAGVTLSPKLPPWELPSAEERLRPSLPTRVPDTNRTPDTNRAGAALPLPAQPSKSEDIPSVSTPFKAAPIESIPTLAVAALPASEVDEPNAETMPLENAAYQSDGYAINIKGRSDGVAIEIGKGNWEILLAGLKQRLAQSGTFFRGGNVALDVAERSMGEAELRAVCDLMVQYGLKPALVRTSSDRTFQSALGMGLASNLETRDGNPVETILPAASGDGATHYVYRGALRSGQILKRRSHILIIGDVNPGAEVVAGGDILIWGRLRGSAHAGAEGDTRAIIAAFDIDPVHLRIAESVALGNNAQAEQGYRWFWSRNQEKRPELARLVNGQIIIEPWDEARLGGAPVLKKKR